jgi:hypothetical protein
VLYLARVDAGRFTSFGGTPLENATMDPKSMEIRLPSPAIEVWYQGRMPSATVVNKSAAIHSSTVYVGARFGASNRPSMVKLLFTVTCAASIVACSDTAIMPTSTPAVLRTIIVPEAMTGIRIRDRVQLQLIDVLTDGSRRAVAATWASNAPDNAAITELGLLTGVSPGSTVVTAKAASGSFSEGVNVVFDCAATFSGQIQVVACKRESGLGQDTCAVGLTNPAALAIAQDGDRISGTLTLYTAKASGNVIGVLLPSGVFELKGTITRPEDDATITILSCSTRVTDECANIEGVISVERSWTNIYGPQRYLEDYQLLHVSRP